jgi:hypothetical protein
MTILLISSLGRLRDLEEEEGEDHEGCDQIEEVVGARLLRARTAGVEPIERVERAKVGGTTQATGVEGTRTKARAILRAGTIGGNVGNRLVERNTLRGADHYGNLFIER